MLDYSNLRWVRLYVDKRPKWRALNWKTRALMSLLLLEVDSRGVIDLGEDGLELLAFSLNAPLEEILPHIERLAAVGSIELLPDKVILPNWENAQTAIWGNSAKCRAYRERKRNMADTRSVTSNTSGVGSDTRSVTSNTSGVGSDTNGVSSSIRDTESVNLDTRSVNLDTDGVRNDTKGVNCDTSGVRSDSTKTLSKEAAKLARNRVIQEALRQISQDNRSSSDTCSDTRSVTSNTSGVGSDTQSVTSNTSGVRNDTNGVSSSIRDTESVNLDTRSVNLDTRSVTSDTESVNRAHLSNKRVKRSEASSAVPRSTKTCNSKR